MKLLRNEKGESLVDAVVLTGMFILLLVPPLVLDFKGIWNGGILWGGFWLAVALLLGGAEAYAYFLSKEKLTLTQYLRRWAQTSKTNLWISRGLLLVWTVAWLLLVFGHLWVY